MLNPRGFGISILFGLLIAVAFHIVATGQAKAQTTSDINSNNIQSVDSSLTHMASKYVDHPPAGQKITLQEAINIALKNNYKLKQAKNNISLARKKVRGAKADFLPSINGRLRGRRTVGQQFVQTTVKFSNVVSNSLTGALSATIPIFQGFRNIINLRQKNINKKYRQASKQRIKETVIFNAVSGFLQVVLNQQLLKIARQALTASKKQLRQVKGQVQVGGKPKVDLYNQQATVATKRVKVVKQKNALSYSKSKLMSILQLDPTKSYTFVSPDLDKLQLIPLNLNLDHLIRQALANRHDLKAQQLLIKRKKKQIRLNRSYIFPSLSVNAGINTQYNDQYRIGPRHQTTVGFSDQFFDQNVNTFVGFTLDIPIFNNFDNRLQVQKAKVKYQNSKLQYHHLRYTVMKEVRQAYNDYRSYSQQLQSTRRALKAARKSYVTQRERYKVGAGSLLEYAEAQADYVKARSNRTQAVLRFIFQRKLLSYYLGNIDRYVSWDI